AKPLAHAKASGFKVLIGVGGQAAMGLAHEYGPDAIVLDLDVEKGLLEKLKQEPRTRHLPVVAIGDPDSRQSALRCGAAMFLERGGKDDALDEALAELVAFIDRPLRHVLVVEDDDQERNAVSELVGGEG